MLNPAAYDNSRLGGFGVLEVSNGAGPQEPRRPHFVPLKRTVLNGEVMGPLAALTLVQIYGYSRAQCDQVLEALYRFPLPGDAAVTGVTVRFGDVEIRTELRPREAAEKRYEEAKAQGRQAVLLTRESPDVFTLRVSGLRPDEDVTIETAYVERVRGEGAGWRLRIPLTTAPRYVRSDETTSRHAQGQPLELLRDPGHRFALDLTILGAESVESPTHRLAMSREGERLRVRLLDGEVLPDRDCVLSWRPVGAEREPVLKVFLHRDPATAEPGAPAHAYFLALVTPPSSPSRASVPQEVVILVDHSGSMDGAKWEAADWAVKKLLCMLSARDAFSLGVFHDRTRWFAPQPLPADSLNIEQATRFLEAQRDSGGTELGVALEQALCLTRGRGFEARHVIIITDAEVTDAGRILRLAREEFQRPDRRRISVLCIDSAPNSFLVHQLVESAGGIARFLTSSPDEEDVTTALDTILEDWASPVMAGARLEINGQGVEAAGRAVESPQAPGWPAVDLGDLPAGRSVWVVGRIRTAPQPEPLFRLASGKNPAVTLAGGSIAVESCGASDRAVSAGRAIKALFGAWRVLALESLIHGNYPQEELRDYLRRFGYQAGATQEGKPVPLYAENARKDAEAAVRGLLVQEALEYGLASSETAFVAVRTEAGQPVAGTVVVANAFPSGWAEPAAGWAGQAAGGLRAGGLSTILGAKDYTLSDDLSDVDAGSVPILSAKSAGFAPARQQSGTDRIVFSGSPQFEQGRAVLFDSSRQQAPGQVESQLLTSVTVRFADKGLHTDTLDRGLMLLIFVGDLATPRAKVSLRDLARQGGKRPLNLRKRAGELVQIVLEDAAGVWVRGAPRIEVALTWES